MIVAPFLEKNEDANEEDSEKEDGTPVYRQFAAPTIDTKPPTDWWGPDDDASLILGTDWFGYMSYQQMIADKRLSFARHAGLLEAFESQKQKEDDGAEAQDAQDEVQSSHPVDVESAEPSTSSATDDAASSVPSEATTEAKKDEPKDGEQEPAIAKESVKDEDAMETSTTTVSAAPSAPAGPVRWPSNAELNMRLRKLVNAHQRVTASSARRSASIEKDRAQQVIVGIYFCRHKAKKFFFSFL